MGNTIKSHDTTGVSESSVNLANADPLYRSAAAGRGVFCDNILEGKARHNVAPCEKVNKHGNACITLGRDRPASPASGYGGAGHTQASSIDICVGAGGTSPDSSLTYDPNFISDGGRIYISQKTDIDANFRLAPGNMGRSTARSGIGIKADSVRVIGIDGIKLVTRGQNKNSKGGSASCNGIEIIALNDDRELQSMVKGDSLIEALTALEERFNELSSEILNHLKDQLQFNLKVMKHTHFVIDPITGPIENMPSFPLQPAGINSTSDTAQSAIDNFKHRVNTNILWHNKYLNPASSKYICSRYNKVN